MLLRLTVIGIVLGAVALAQTDRGTLTGVIADPAGAVIPNAAIELRGVETGTVYPAVTRPRATIPFRNCRLERTSLQSLFPGLRS